MYKQDITILCTKVVLLPQHSKQKKCSVLLLGIFVFIWYSSSKYSNQHKQQHCCCCTGIYLFDSRFEQLQPQHPFFARLPWLLFCCSPVLSLMMMNVVMVALIGWLISRPDLLCVSEKPAAGWRESVGGHVLITEYFRYFCSNYSACLSPGRGGWSVEQFLDLVGLWSAVFSAGSLAGWPINYTPYFLWLCCVGGWWVIGWYTF